MYPYAFAYDGELYCMDCALTQLPSYLSISLPVSLPESVSLLSDALEASGRGGPVLDGSEYDATVYMLAPGSGYCLPECCSVCRAALFGGTPLPMMPTIDGEYLPEPYDIQWVDSDGRYEVRWEPQESEF